MLILHNAAKNENLFHSLVSTIKKCPLQNTFSKELFLVSSQGIERWLSQQLATEFRLWGNYQFLLPSQFFKQISRQIDSQLSNSAFNQDLLLWRVEELLRHLENDVYAPLKQYLQGDNVSIKRYQLAGEISRLFDNYQLLRPDLLNAWQQGHCLTENDDEHWQRALWLLLCQENESHHQANLWQMVINKLHDTESRQFRYRLPERVFVFGINSLPPLQLDYLQALSRHCDVHFYLHNPLPTITSLEQASPHPLIATLGQQVRDFQQLLLERTGFQLQEIKVDFVPTNNLQQLQHNMTRQDRMPCKLENDDSISIHACHSRVREVEVLKDRLLEMLETDAELELRDIVVTAPDIQVYAPFIDSVFDGIPHSISGRNLRLSNGVLDAFIRFLQLAGSRFEWQAVIDLLELPCVFPAFDLNESDLPLLRHWLDKTRVRWGKSGGHKKELGLPGLDENTWQASLERLLMGYAVAGDDSFVDEVLPYHHLEGSSAQVLGGLNDFLQLLFKASEELTQPRSFQNWQEILYQYAGQLFTENNETQALYNLLADFSENLGEINPQAIELGVIVSWLETALTEQKSASGLLRGKLTFSPINAVRGIPFKVIAVLGLNDGDFPGVEKSPTFDLLSSQLRLGDPSRRTDDRQQFLELILAAKERLLLSYIGQSQSQNETIPPSVVISELLEVLEQDYQLKDLVIRHPLQSFSHRYFDGQDARLFSYSADGAETAMALMQEREMPSNWWSQPIAANAGEVIELEELRKFFRHPQNYFMQRQLDVRFQGLEDTPEAREPFAIDGLEAYSINQDWIEALLQQQDFSLEKLQAQGCWLSGVPGAIEFAKQQDEIFNFVGQIQSLELGEPVENLALDVNVCEYRIIGKLYHLHENGSLFYRYAKLKGKDFLLALLHHCLVNLNRPQPTYLLSLDELIVLTEEHQNPEILQRLLGMYLQGLQRPDVLFADIALDYVRQVEKLEKSTRAQKPAAEVAADKLRLALEKPHEMALQRLFGNSEDCSELLSEEFIEFCEFLAPLWMSLNQE